MDFINTQVLRGESHHEGGADQNEGQLDEDQHSPGLFENDAGEER